MLSLFRSLNTSDTMKAAVLTVSFVAVALVTTAFIAVNQKPKERRVNPYPDEHLGI